MFTKFTDLHCKEVICVSDGRRLGYISDARVDLCDGQIIAIIVPGPCRFLGLWGRKDDYVIPWRCICKMGPDIVLVDIKPDLFSRWRQSRKFFCPAATGFICFPSLFPAAFLKNMGIFLNFFGKNTCKMKSLPL